MDRSRETSIDPTCRSLNGAQIAQLFADKFFFQLRTLGKPYSSAKSSTQMAS